MHTIVLIDNHLLTLTLLKVTVKTKNMFWRVKLILIVVKIKQFSQWGVILIILIKSRIRKICKEVPYITHIVDFKKQTRKLFNLQRQMVNCEVKKVIATQSRCQTLLIIVVQNTQSN